MATYYYGDKNNYPEKFKIPSAGDKPRADAWDPALEALGDRTAYLEDQLTLSVEMIHDVEADMTTAEGKIAILGAEYLAHIQSATGDGPIVPVNVSGAPLVPGTGGPVAEIFVETTQAQRVAVEFSFDLRIEAFATIGDVVFAIQRVPAAGGSPTLVGGKCRLRNTASLETYQRVQVMAYVDLPVIAGNIYMTLYAGKSTSFTGLTSVEIYNWAGRASSYRSL